MTLVFKIVIVYALILGLLLLNQNRLIFRPSRDFPLKPSQFALQPEEVHFKSADGTDLHGWFFSSVENAPYLLFCHGNAGNISDRLPNIKLLLEIPINAFIFDYRGYGLSQGKPTEKGVYEDAEAAYEFLHKKKRAKPELITVFGRSLGGAIAIELALRKPVGSMILESTFYSLKDLVGRIFPYMLFYPFIPSRFNNGEKIKNIHVPVLFIHGDADTTVPWTQGKKLFEAANHPKEFWLVKGAHHTDAYEINPTEYLSRLRDFILTTR